MYSLLSTFSGGSALEDLASTRARRELNRPGSTCAEGHPAAD